MNPFDVGWWKCEPRPPFKVAADMEWLIPRAATAKVVLDCWEKAGDRIRTGDVQLGKLAFYR